MNTRFDDRQDAGRQIAGRLEDYRDRRDLTVLGLARGGVAVAAEVARALETPLDVIVVRKLGAPGRQELAMGALAPEGARVLNDDVLAAMSISEQAIAEVEKREADRLRRQLTVYRDDHPPPDIGDRTILLVDDGLATGASMRAAIEYVQSNKPRSVVVAAPTGSDNTCSSIAREVDELICPYRPHPFVGISQAYRDFRQVDDETVQKLLRQR